MSPMQPIAAGVGVAECYQPWKLQQLPEGFFISTPATVEQPLGCEFIKAPDATGDVQQPDAPGLPEALIPAGEDVNGYEVSFVHVSCEEGSNWSSDARRVTHLQSEKHESLLLSVKNLPDGHTVRQFLKHGAHYFALAEDLQAGQLTHSKLYRQHKSEPDRWQKLVLPVQEMSPGQRFSHLASYHDRLYVAMDDEISGFHLWYSEVENPAETDWIEVVCNGAYHFTANAFVSAIYVEQDRMLIACAASQSLAGIKSHPVGAELIVVQGDHWGLIAGSTRISPEGLVVPIGAMGRGFDDPAASRITSISRSGVEYLVALHSCNDSDSAVVNTLWSSRDLVDWQELELPSLFAEESMTLLGAYRQGSAILYAVQRFANDDLYLLDESSHGAADLIQAALPQGVELWMEEYAD